MISKKFLVSIVTVFALAVLMAGSATAFGSITDVEVNGVDALSGENISALAGRSLPVKVVFTATEDASDVRVKAWIAGEDVMALSSDRFDVITGSVYTEYFVVNVPTHLDLTEELALQVSVEGKSAGVADQVEVSLAGQRDTYSLEVLDVSTDSFVQSGDELVLDVVIKNRGRISSEDTYVRASIPSLGLEDRVYLGDISPVDDVALGLDDVVSAKLTLNVPMNVAAGVYTLEVGAFNSETSSTVSQNLAVVGAGLDTMIASSATAKTFAVGEAGEYSLTIVNSDDRVRVYELFVESDAAELSVDLDSSIIVVPAGTSKTVNFDVSASREDTYGFSVKVGSSGELVEKVDFTANVEGNKVMAADPTVLLTVVLAIIFVVLLVVLIVLLSRKPEKAEELSESYY